MLLPDTFKFTECPNMQCLAVPQCLSKCPISTCTLRGLSLQLSEGALAHWHQSKPDSDMRDFANLPPRKRLSQSERAAYQDRRGGTGWPTGHSALCQAAAVRRVRGTTMTKAKVFLVMRSLAQSCLATVLDLD